MSCRRYSGDSFENVRQIHEEWPGKHIMATEACNCDGPKYGAEGWSRAETYVHDILGDLNAFSRGWTDWNILLNQRGGPNHVSPPSPRTPRWGLQQQQQQQ